MAVLRREQVAGMNTHYVYYSLDYFFASMEKAHFSTIAFWGGPPHFRLDHRSFDDCAAIKKKARAHGLSIQCFTSAGCTYGYQVGMHEDYREKSFQYFANGIRACAELGSRQMAISSGWGFWNEDREAAWERSRDMLTRLAEFAKGYEVTLTMESLRRAESQLAYTLADTKRMFNEVNHPNFKIMVDTTAMGVARETLDQWFHCFGANIRNMHFVDGDPNGHLAWGDGIQPLDKYIHCLFDNNYSGLLGLEITHSRYLNDPLAADIQCMRALSCYF